MRISILNAGQQTDYLYGLVSGLSEIPHMEIEVVDSDSAVGVFEKFRQVFLYNLRGDNISPQSIPVKMWRIGRYYIRLCYYTLRTSSKIFHIQWDNSIAFIDRTLLILYYKLFGKKIVFTAHNVYREERDDKASPIRWLSLKIMYHLVDRIIVHTARMKEELCTLFRISSNKVFVVSHGINNRIQPKGITLDEARKKLNIKQTAQVILFFGQIDTYKGIETLIDAAALYGKEDPSMVLLIAGKSKRRNEYVQTLRARAAAVGLLDRIQFFPEHIPEDEVEMYFSAADCVVLPYKKIFQSGVIFLAYRFGIPLVATDVGSFKEDIIQGETGFICVPNDPVDLASGFRKFFQSNLYHQREETRTRIRAYAEQRYSWTDIGHQTFEIYKDLVKES